jgi:DNA mismatch endonuclease Vsr
MNRTTSNRSRRSKREIASYKMSRVRPKNTDIERIMGSALHSAGIVGYRKNVKGILGTPDFCWRAHRLAVFCDSSFWHGYNWRKQKTTIKVRKKFWFEKIATNIRRDKAVTKGLRQDGWQVLRFWDFQIKENPTSCVLQIARSIQIRHRRLPSVIATAANTPHHVAHTFMAGEQIPKVQLESVEMHKSRKAPTHDRGF